MGANCCTPTKGKALSFGTSTQFSTHRNVSYSPSWSLRWDNRTHIEDLGAASERSILGNSGNSRHIGREAKSQTDAEADGLSDGGSVLGSSGTPSWPKAPVDEEVGRQKVNEEDPHISFSCSSEGGHPKALDSLREEPSSSMTHQSNLVEPSSSRNPRHGYFSLFKTPHEDSSVPSLCSNDLSHGGSSDGWSMRMFSELVATSQKERYSFDSESISSCQSKITQSDGHHLSYSPAGDSCGICSKLLKERCPWSYRKIISNGSRSSSIIAVLVCGHAFHAECLENVTGDADKYDPPCPICGGLEKFGSAVLKSEVRLRNKVSKRAVADLYSDSKFIEGYKFPGMSSTGPAADSNSGFMGFGKPFLKRHFSIGSRTAEPSLLGSAQARRRGFWGRWREQ
ncbi:uncharacterized protein LOC144700715 [Wolffia australiana]